MVIAKNGRFLTKKRRFGPKSWKYPNLPHIHLTAQKNLCGQIFIFFARSYRRAFFNTRKKFQKKIYISEKNTANLNFEISDISTFWLILEIFSTFLFWVSGPVEEQNPNFFGKKFCGDPNSSNMTLGRLERRFMMILNDLEQKKFWGPRSASGYIRSCTKPL